VPVLKSIENIPDVKEDEDFDFRQFSSEDLMLEESEEADQMISKINSGMKKL
jgi:hypothetical protein